MVLELLRVGQSAKGTFGVLRREQVPFALTLELPWKDNAEDISCIPEGRYVCKRIVSPHFGDVFEITGVMNRTHVLLHKANKLSDLKGCIGVGEEFGGTFDNPELADSKKGFEEFMALTVFLDEFELLIRRCDG